MFRKIALGTVLAVGSISGAFAWDNGNIGAIGTAPNYVQTSAGYEALAAARHTRTVRQAPQTLQAPTRYDPAGNVSEY